MQNIVLGTVKSMSEEISSEAISEVV